MKIKLILAASILLVSGQANAALIDNGILTTDTTSGLDWLDLTETKGLSYDYVYSQLSIDGIYEGWRYATVAETSYLFQQFGFSIGTYSENPITDGMLASITTMVGYLGDTFGDSYPEHYGSRGIVDFAPDIWTHQTIDSYTWDFGARGWIQFSSDYRQNDDHSQSPQPSGYSVLV